MKQPDCCSTCGVRFKVEPPINPKTRVPYKTCEPCRVYHVAYDKLRREAPPTERRPKTPEQTLAQAKRELLEEVQFAWETSSNGAFTRYLQTRIGMLDIESTLPLERVVVHAGYANLGGCDGE